MNETCPNCALLGQVNTFDEVQTSECQKSPSILHSLSKGARAAIIDCQLRFNESRWNCSTLYGDDLFGAFIANTTCRERGVLNAYFAAGATSAIGEDCHNQRIAACPCTLNDGGRSEDGDGNVIFTACNSDFSFACDYINTFVLEGLDTTSCRGQVDEHNINVGKQIVNESIESCRCHGVSGTCAVKTCYNRIKTVAEVGEKLFQLYNGAVRVAESDDGDLVNANFPSVPVKKTDILYKDHSPNFCVEDDALGTLGVAHRLCDPNSNMPNACSTICCDYGNYELSKVVEIEECKFVWCCDIVCSTVRNDTVVEHRCNPPPPTPVVG